MLRSIGGRTTSPSARVPSLLPRRGLAQVAEFFATIDNWTVLDFAVLDVLAPAGRSSRRCGPHSRCPGGGRFADEELHLWTFNDAGKVTRLRHHCDTAKHIAASRGEDTTTAVWTWRRTLSGRRGPTEQLAFTKAKGRLRG